MPNAEHVKTIVFSPRKEQRKRNIEWFWLFTVIVLMNLPFLVGDACCWFNLLILIFVCNLFWFHCVKAIFDFSILFTGEMLHCFLVFINRFSSRSELFWKCLSSFGINDVDVESIPQLLISLWCVNGKVLTRVSCLIVEWVMLEFLGITKYFHEKSHFFPFPANQEKDLPLNHWDVNQIVLSFFHFSSLFLVPSPF